MWLKVGNYLLLRSLLASFVKRQFYKKPTWELVLVMKHFERTVIIFYKKIPNETNGNLILN